MFAQQGLDLERSFIRDIMNLDQIEPLVRYRHLQNQVISPLRNYLVRASASGRPQAYRNVENTFER